MKSRSRPTNGETTPTSTVQRSRPRDREKFIIDYITAHADENGEVVARDCIGAAEDVGIDERHLTKARHRSPLIGTRRLNRIEGNGSVWYLLFDPAAGITGRSHSMESPVLQLLSQDELVQCARGALRDAVDGAAPWERVLVVDELGRYLAELKRGLRGAA